MKPKTILVHSKALLIALLIMMMGQNATAQNATESSPQKIKVLSWNIYMLPGILAKFNAKRAQRIGEILASSEYDVLVFQEAFCPVARRRIRQQLDTHFAYQAGPANRHWFSIKTNSGIWIVSRYPITSYQSIVFKNRYGVDALSRKGALMVELQVNGKRIQVVGTHLQNSGGAWVRHAQCVELYERLLRPNKIQGIPQIVCGDFNIEKTSSEASYQFMLSSLDAEDGNLEGEKQFTYDRLHNDLHVEKGKRQDLIDYILLRNNGAWANCVNRHILVFKKKWDNHHEDLSDHYSMTAEINFTNFTSVISLR